MLLYTSNLKDLKAHTAELKLKHELLEEKKKVKSCFHEIQSQRQQLTAQHRQIQDLFIYKEYHSICIRIQPASHGLFDPIFLL